jgi:hypothetical protein
MPYSGLPLVVMSYSESPLSSVLSVDPSVSTPADHVCQSTFLTKLYGYDVLRRCDHEYVIGMNPGGAFFPHQPGYRIAPSPASDNYYYEKRKKASEKFATASHNSFTAVYRLAVGFGSARKLLC